MYRILAYLIPILLCFIVGISASYFQSDAIQNWYPTLKKPVLTPPNIVFPIVWSILYLCMGISIGLIIDSASKRIKPLIRIFAFQLFFNFTWSITFFYFQNPLVGFINLIILDVFVINYMIKSYSERKASAYLFIPYIIWILFATYLNGYILIYN